MEQNEKVRLAQVYNNLLHNYRILSSTNVVKGSSGDKVLDKMKVDYEENMDAIRTIFYINGVNYTLNERYLRL